MNSVIVKKQTMKINTTSCLISAIEVRRPLYDHRLQLTKRTEAIKTKLWNEIYVELKGRLKISIYISK